MKATEFLKEHYQIDYETTETVSMILAKIFANAFSAHIIEEVREKASKEFALFRIGYREDPALYLVSLNNIFDETLNSLK